MLTEREIEQQKQLAIAAMKQHGYSIPALITAMTVPDGDRAIAGFRFDPENQRQVGEVIEHSDGCKSIVLCIITPAMLTENNPVKKQK